jgi:hypothetical protein
MRRAVPRRPTFPRTPRRRVDLSYRLRAALHKIRERNQARREEG